MYVFDGISAHTIEVLVDVYEMEIGDALDHTEMVKINTRGKINK